MLLIADVKFINNDLFINSNEVNICAYSKAMFNTGVFHGFIVYRIITPVTIIINYGDHLISE